MSKDHNLPTPIPESDYSQFQLAYFEAERRLYTRLRQQARIEKWKIGQRSEQQWLNFSDIADHLSRKPGGIARDEEARAQAQHDLIRSIAVTREFSLAGRIRVAYLPTNITFYGRQLGLRLVPIGLRPHHLDDCWAPRELWEKWFAARPDLRLPPGMLIPSVVVPAISSTFPLTEPEPPSVKSLTKPVELKAWNDWLKQQHPRKPTRREAEQWARLKKYSSTDVRRLHKNLGTKLGRPRNEPGK